MIEKDGAEPAEAQAQPARAFTMQIQVAKPRIDFRQTDTLFHPVIASETFLGSIGRIIVNWSRFELTFQHFFEALVVSSGADIATVKSLRSFDKKIERSRSEIGREFSGDPSLKRFLLSFMEDVSKFQFKRNCITHGQVAVGMNVSWNDKGDHVENFYLAVHTIYKGKKTELRFTEEELDRLYHSLGNLSGRMTEISDPSFLADFPKLSLLDKSRLSDFLRKHHPIHASGSKSESQPPTSAA